MGEINMPRDEQDAVRAVDIDMLDKLIDQCVYEERPGAMHRLGLASCGLFVAQKLRAFERALTEYGKAKAAKKRAETRESVLRAGSDLAHAVQQMKDRAETEQKEGQVFCVDDQIVSPYSFSEKLTVCVSYRWRQSTEGDWASGRITFSHDFDSRPDYTQPLSKRKPSATKVEEDRQNKLRREWERLRNLALCSVRDFLKNGGNGNAIPQTFSAKTDPYSRGLNNYSADFWREQS